MRNPVVMAAAAVYAVLSTDVTPANIHQSEKQEKKIQFLENADASSSLVEKED